MNEEQIKQILNKIGRAEIPPEAAGITELTSQRFAAALGLSRPRFFTPLRLLAAAATIILAFALGRWSKPIPPTSSNITAYATSVPTHTSGRKDNDGFWQQKMLATMRPRPYARTGFDKGGLLKSYKQYLRNQPFDIGE